jgi:cytochrome oxidase Cu insertion factor (SCO1/SenC/PrrC family)
VAGRGAAVYIRTMTSQPKRADRLLWGLMIGMMVAAAVAVVIIWNVVRSGPRDAALGNPAIGGPFALVDQTGRPVTDQSYKGLYRLIYFGYTFCPDACPTELQVMAQAVDDLGDAGDRVQPIFITIDPERDTVKQLAGYVPNFHKRLAGLTGSPEQIAQVAKEYKVYYAKAEQPDSQAYLMNHSSFVYLLDPDGRFITVFPSDMDAEKMASELRKYMAGS